MTAHSNDNNSPVCWVDGELRLVGLDKRMAGLLKAIDQSGSINQAARQVGLSYKGAWQIIEKANNGAPKTLVCTSIGGSKGGGTCLTEAGRSLLALFTRLEQQHRQFLDQLNRSLTRDPDTVLLLQRLVVKTSACNQLFGNITAIQGGAVNAEVRVRLKAGETIMTCMAQASLSELELKIGADAVLLINSDDIMVVTDSGSDRFSARNRLSGQVLRMQQDEVNAQVIILLAGGETLTASITRQSAQAMEFIPGMTVSAIFKASTPILGVLSA
ncbi:MAG: molybdenum-dependent transcriptional regulator [Gammaproteobacteria bacterium HGW-Gammaproteobacteria-3]|nr:MAG: molybdenum-dependent transcriptional regulator [Gammaproteobacteria bacterium HGW-Gammaproteobacteria-3]